MVDQKYDCVKLHNTAYMMACRPVVIYAVLMSILFEHYKQLTSLLHQQKVKDTAEELTSTLDLWQKKMNHFLTYFSKRICDCLICSIQGVGLDLATRVVIKEYRLCMLSRRKIKHTQN